MKLLTLAFLTLVAAPAGAQTMPMTTPLCPADAQPVPAELAGWSQRKPLTAATAIASVPGAKIVPGQGVDLVLSDTPAVIYPLRPSHPGGSVSHGGMVSLAITRAGTYRIAIGNRHSTVPADNWF